jgi:hypothetical protein
MLSKMVSERSESDSEQGNTTITNEHQGQLMKSVKIEFSSDGIVIMHAGFKVLQGNRVLVEDSLSGKISDVFVRQKYVLTALYLFSLRKGISPLKCEGHYPELSVLALLIR